MSRAAGAAAIAAFMMGGAAACKADSPSDTGGTGNAACGLKIGFFGALTGDAAGLGIHMRNGTKMAIDQYNKANADCKVELVEMDSQGDPAKAPALAPAGRRRHEGGRRSSARRSRVSPRWPNPIFEEAGLPTITPSATRPSLSHQGLEDLPPRRR